LLTTRSIFDVGLRNMRTIILATALNAAYVAPASAFDQRPFQKIRKIKPSVIFRGAGRHLSAGTEAGDRIPG
jgi:hypothetical protein